MRTLFTQWLLNFRTRSFHSVQRLQRSGMIKEKRLVNSLNLWVVDFQLNRFLDFHSKWFWTQCSGEWLALENERFLVRARSLVMCQSELSAVIAWLMFKVFVNWVEMVMRVYDWRPPSPAAMWFVNALWKKTQIEKNWNLQKYFSDAYFGTSRT